MNRRKHPDQAARLALFIAAGLVSIGISSMAWDALIGGRLVSESPGGPRTHAMPPGGAEEFLATMALFVLPFVILWGSTEVQRRREDRRPQAEPAN